ncbi:MAG: hypothetical protein JXN60_03615 [Lentisphaerae bacterium]|nr:hypothetical protein [Lentisphaerota bacterium]
MKKILGIAVALIAFGLYFPCVAQCANILENSSFEVGAQSHGWSGYKDAPYERFNMYARGISAKPLNVASKLLGELNYEIPFSKYYGQELEAWDESVSFHGKRSLKLYMEHVPFPMGASCTLQSRVYTVVPGKPYTLSFYVRTDIPSLLVNAGINPAFMTVKDKTQWGGSGGVTITEPGQWERVACVFTAPAESDGNCFINIAFFSKEEGFAWIDAFQIEEGGEPTEYKPIREIEAGISVAPDGGIFLKSERAILEFHFYNNCSVKKRQKYTLKVFDYFNRCVFEKPVKVTCIPGEKASKRMAVDLDAQGIFRAELYEGDRVEDEKVFIILPPPNKEPGFLGVGTAQSWTARQCRILQKLGIGYHRMGEYLTHWKNTELVKDRYIFFPEFAEQSYKHGIKGMGVLGWKIPDWVYTFRSGTHWTVRDAVEMSNKDFEVFLKEFGEYVFKTVNAYKEYIKYWEVFNESYNMFGSMPERYMQVFKVAHEQARKADPDCFIVGPSSSHRVAQSYSESLVKMGFLKYCDVFSFHAYDAFTPTGLEKIVEWARADGNTKREIWSTEAGGAGYANTFYRKLPNVGTIQGQIGRDVSVAVPYDVGAEQGIYAVLTCYAMGVNRFLYYGLGPFGDPRPAMYPRGYAQFDGTPAPFVVALSIADNLVGTSKIRKEIEISDAFRSYLFGDAPAGRSVALLYSSLKESPPWVEDPNWKLFLDVQTANEEMVREHLKDREHTLLMEIPTEGKNIKLLDIMGNEIKGSIKKGDILLAPISTSPVYLVGKDVDNDWLEEKMKYAVVHGLSDIDVYATLAASPGGRASIAVLLSNNQVYDRNVEVSITIPSDITLSGKDKQTVSLGARGKETVFFPMEKFAVTESGRSVQETKITVTDKAHSKSFGASFNHAIATAKRVIKPPKIDGNLQEWVSYGATPVKLEKVIRGEQYWKDAADLSGEIRMVWDEKNLYCAMKVNDAGGIKRRPKTGLSMWYDDSVELFFDIKIMENLLVKSYTEFDNQLMLGPADGVNNKEAHWAATLGMEGVEVASKQTPRGYEMEVLIPLVNLRMEGKAGSTVGFDAALNDVDMDGNLKKYKKMDWLGEKQIWLNPRTMGRLILAE